MQLLKAFWNTWLEFPFRVLDINLSPKLILAIKIVVLIVLGIVVLDILSFLKRKFFNREQLIDDDEMAALLASDEQFIQTVKRAANPDALLLPLKRAKKYAYVGKAYSALNRPKEAAKWYGKGKLWTRAAFEWANAGKNLKAAKLFLKEGEHVKAARLLEQEGQYLKAAEAYQEGNDMQGAAAAYANAGKYDEAVQFFARYFTQTHDGPERRLEAAEACLAMLQSPGGREAVPDEFRRKLLPAIAAQYAESQRHDTAAQLYIEAKDMLHAGEVFLAAGNLVQAEKCMREAGNQKEANQIAGRYHEKQEQWLDAGKAYAAGGEFQRAGDCFAKANEAEHAAQCYEKAGEDYGAALAYAHLEQHQKAIQLLQHIKEEHPRFDESRALLGKCFYQMRDFAHAAATLDNHLTGKRVETGNVDYFYMLALAWEQLGELEKSREILYKVHSVNVHYRDVTTRISNISSRISMTQDLGGTPPPKATVAMQAQETQVMTMVENLLGGRYRLERELGRGGMGVVYLASDTQLDRPVALKFLGSLLDNSESYRQRFIREAKAAAKVNHPNIISIYEISTQVGKTFIAMEYVEGASLNRYIADKGAFQPRRAINIIAQSCSALSAIHEAGIIHRDIKPDNILLAKGGLVKLTDFGLAKAQDSHVTGAGVIMGTPPYMSPEQTLGSDVDARSDIYAIGLVFHEMLTGRIVFGDGDILKRQQTEMPPPPSALSPDVPPELDRIVMKCLAKNPDERYQSVQEIIEELRTVNK